MKGKIVLTVSIKNLKLDFLILALPLSNSSGLSGMVPATL